MLKLAKIFNLSFILLILITTKVFSHNPKNENFHSNYYHENSHIENPIKLSDQILLDRVVWNYSVDEFTNLMLENKSKFYPHLKFTPFDVKDFYDEKDYFRFEIILTENCTALKTSNCNFGYNVLKVLKYLNDNGLKPASLSEIIAINSGANQHNDCSDRILILYQDFIVKDNQYYLNFSSKGRRSSNCSRFFIYDQSEVKTEDNVVTIFAVKK